MDIKALKAKTLRIEKPKCLLNKLHTKYLWIAKTDNVQIFWDGARAMTL